MSYRKQDKSEPERQILGPLEEVPEGLRRAIAYREVGVDSQSLLAELTRVWGGHARLAADFYTEFKNAPSGGQTRQRILEMMQRLIINNTKDDLSKVRRPSDMTKDELERVAADLMRKVLEHDRQQQLERPE